MQLGEEGETDMKNGRGRAGGIRGRGRAQALLLAGFIVLVWAIPSTSADHRNDEGLVYFIESDGGTSDEVVNRVAETVLGGLVSEGFGQALGAATSRLIGKMGGLFTTFLLEMPIVGNPTYVELALVADGEVYTRSVALSTNPAIFVDGRSRETGGRSGLTGGVRYRYPPAAALVIVTPGDCINAPTTLRLDRAVSLFRWETVWQRTILTFDEHMDMNVQIGVPFVVACTTPIAIGEAGRYRLVAESWCSGHEGKVRIAVTD